MANTIERNTYSRLSYGNRASGANAGGDDGLLYLCNTNETFLPLPDPLVLPAAIRVDPGGSIRNPQAVQNELGIPTFPAGNEFIDLAGISIENLGEKIAYYYYDDPQGYQDPDGTGFPPVGIGANPEVNELNVSNPNCAQPEPCTPPCDEEELEASKNNFHQNKESWLDEKAAYPLITEEEGRQEALKKIAGLRRQLNKDAKNILTHYRQDTLSHEPDSVLHWLSLVETYPADYRLARDELFLWLPENGGTGRAVFYNLQGKPIQSLPLPGGLNRFPLSTELFKTGIYLLKVYQGSSSSILKVAIH